MEKEKIIIDTDPGHDDAMAILMLLPQKVIEIKAITTVAGNSAIKNTTRNAMCILDLANRHNIALYSGSSKPLKRKLVRAIVHGKSGLDGLNRSKIKSAFLTNNAPEKIVEIVKKNPGKITLLTLGPLTNIAQAFLLEPAITSKIKKIIMMGGAISVPGNENRVAEFNFFVDPEAAEIIFNAKVKKILLPLDPCNEILLSDKEIDSFGQGKVAKALKKMLIPYIKNIARFENIKGALMYDPLAAYYLLNPSAFKTRLMDIAIETKGKLTRGMTVVEKRLAIQKSENTEVITKIDKKSFIEDFIKSIKTLDEN